jgi:polygalacturonase
VFRLLSLDSVRRQSLKVLNSRDVVISGLTSVDSELYHVVVDGCEGVTVQDVQIVAPGSSPNTDGIHVQASSQVTVTRTSIQTGDDCVSVGPGTTNLRVEHVSCGPGHGIRCLASGLSALLAHTTLFSLVVTCVMVRFRWRPA